MKPKTLIATICGLLVAGLLSAQSIQDLAGAILARSVNTSRFVSAVSTHQVLLVKYVGTSASGSVAIDAGTGDLTFTSGAEGGEVAETAFECPISGALGGVIDVSDAACNTLGEVVDTINGSCSGCSTTAWRAVILDGLRSDTSTDALATISATAATAEDGLALLGDTAVTFDVTAAVTPFRSIKHYISGQNSRMVENPYVGTKPILYKAIGTSTYGLGTSTFEVFCVTPKLRTAGSVAGAETVTTAWSEAGGATTAAKTFDFTPGIGLACSADQKMVVRLNNSAAMTAATLPVWAAQFNPR